LCVAVCCSVLQRVAVCCSGPRPIGYLIDTCHFLKNSPIVSATRCNALHTYTPANSRRSRACSQCNKLQHAATRRNTLQLHCRHTHLRVHIALALVQPLLFALRRHTCISDKTTSCVTRLIRKRCVLQQHTPAAPHCNTLHYTATTHTCSFSSSCRWSRPHCCFSSF